MLREVDSALSEADVEILSRLGRRFLNSGLGLLLRSYREINQRIGVLEFDRTFLLPAAVDLVDLFCVGKPANAENIVAAIGAAEVGVLINHNVLVERNDLLSANGLRLIDHFGALLFVGAGSRSNTLYFGDDSSAFGSWLLGVPRGRCLDLCCGVGTQTILCARRGEEAIGVEQNQEAIRIACINAAINGVAVNVRFCHGDVLDVISEIPPALGRFDTICCNPPLIPVPEAVPFPYVGNGGEDGLSFPAAILPALPDLLEPEGRCYIIGTVLGSGEEPDLTRITGIIEDCGLRALMIVPAVRNIRRGEPFRKLLEYTSIVDSARQDLNFEDVTNAWEALIARGSHLYSFCLVATLAKPYAPSGLQFTRHFERNENFWKV